MARTLVADTLADYELFLANAPRATKRAARLAINQTLDRVGLPEARALLAQEVAFPAGYLDDPRRLRVSKKASDSDLQGALFARQRPTSLARFALAGSPVGGGPGGVAVRVAANGPAVRLARSWLVRLRSGAEDPDESSYNLGLAIRLRPGESIRNKRIAGNMRRLDSRGAFLLYGPSVNQVFRTVAESLAPKLGDAAEAEFLRQFNRLSAEGV